MGYIKSYKSISGNKITHFDEHGNKIGVSYKSASGKRITHFDANGNKSGTSYRNDYGRIRHYDSTGTKTGTSYVRPSGVVKHFDENGNSAGNSYHSITGTAISSYTPKRSASEPPSNHSSNNDKLGTGFLGCLTIFFIYLVITELVGIILG